MKKPLLTIVFLLAALFATAQTGSITVTSVQQRTDGSGLVDIYFNLSGPGSAYNIAMQASFDGGSTYAPIPPAFLSGDIAGINPGSNRHIVWDGLGSFPATYSTQSRLELTATEVTGSGTPCPGMPSFTDPRDGQTYNTVQIGSQCWMKENLNYPTENSWCYDNNASYCTTYGRLYTWDAALTACPSGWHLPSNEEWWQLAYYIVSQGFPFNGFDPNGVGNALKSCRQVNSPLGGGCNTSEHPRWNAHSTHHGFDEFGFSAFSGGECYSDSTFYFIGDIGYWWSSTEHHTTSSVALSRVIYSYLGSTHEASHYKVSGFSVRCLSSLEPITYELNLQINPADAGTVYGQGEYEAGEQVSITAGANPGWEFINWIDEDNNEVSAEASFIYTMLAQDITFIANFEEDLTSFDCGDTFTDPRDGQTYNTVQIISQCWMKENLNYPTANSWCYDNNASYCTTYGRLYTWSVALTACPSGWHLPSDVEWTVLTEFLGGVSIAGGKLKSTLYWYPPNTGATNETGFSALPGGYRLASGTVTNIGYNGSWWSATEISSAYAYAWYRGMYYSQGSVSRYFNDKTNGFSVRCLRD